MNLQSSPSRSVKRSDFGASVSGGELVVPAELVAAFGRPVRSAEELVAYLQTFPTSVAQRLGWTADEVATAKEGLLDRLRGILPDALLEVPSAPERRLGAMPPRWPTG
jgi:hypothetical protein